MGVPSFLQELLICVCKKRIEPHRKAGRLKAQASEILSLAPVLQYFCRTIGVEAPCQEACKAFLSQCHFLELLQSIPYGQVSGPSLDRAAEECHRLFDEAGWTAFKIKKFHWVYHYGDSLETHKVLIACFCQERKHKEILTVAKDAQNLPKYEKICVQRDPGRTAPPPPSSFTTKIGFDKPLQTISSHAELVAINWHFATWVHLPHLQLFQIPCWHSTHKGLGTCEL